MTPRRIRSIPGVLAGIGSYSYFSESLLNVALGFAWVVVLAQARKMEYRRVFVQELRLRVLMLYKPLTILNPKPSSI